MLIEEECNYKAAHAVTYTKAYVEHQIKQNEKLLPFDGNKSHDDNNNFRYSLTVIHSSVIMFECNFTP